MEGNMEPTLGTANDTIISEKTYKVLTFDPVDPNSRNAKEFNPRVFLLDTEDPGFKTNFWQELPQEVWESSGSLPNGLIHGMITYNPFGYVMSHTNLKSRKAMTVTLEVE